MAGKAHRKYYRIPSQSQQPRPLLSQQQITQYLLCHSYDLTLKTFQQEIANRNQYSVDWLFQEFQKINNKGRNIAHLDKFLENVRNMYMKARSSNGSQGELCKIQFMVIVWYCSLQTTKTKQDAARTSIRKQKSQISQCLAFLKSYIQKNGTKLSQFPQLLPYFALPYIQQAQSHPFLNRIYQPQWKQELIKQIHSILSVNTRVGRGSNRNSRRKENSSANDAEGNQEWFLIVKDLIYIADSFAKSISKDAKFNEMLSRVNEYKSIIQQQDKQTEQISVNPSQLSNLLYKPDAQLNLDKSFNSISSVHNLFYPNLDFEALQQIFHNIHPQTNPHSLCLLLSELQKRFIGLPIPLRKKQIENYISFNIFLSENQDGVLVIGKNRILEEIQLLKLVNLLCCSGTFVQYLANNPGFVEHLVKAVTKANVLYTVQREQVDELVGSRDQEMVLEVFGILQKISFSKIAIVNILKTSLAETLIQDYLRIYSKLPPNILTYVLALLLNIILKAQGKQKCSQIKCPSPLASTSSFSLLQLLVNIWQHICEHHSPRPSQSRPSQISSTQEQTHLESLIYSIFYILLSSEQNKKLANKISFKQTLLQFLNNNDDQYHQKVITSIIEVLDAEQQDDKKEEDEEEGEGELSEYEDLRSDKEEGNQWIWVGQKLIQVIAQEQPNLQQLIKKLQKQLKPIKQIQKSNISSKQKQTKEPNRQKQTSTLQIKQKQRSKQKQKQKQKQKAHKPIPLKPNHSSMQNRSTPLSQIQPKQSQKRQFKVEESKSAVIQIEKNKEKEKQKSISVGGVNGNVNVGGNKFENAGGYDPHKYSWKKLKTVHQ